MNAYWTMATIVFLAALVPGAAATAQEPEPPLFRSEFDEPEPPLFRSEFDEPEPPLFASDVVDDCCVPTQAERLRRAGCPYSIAPWARFTYGEKYCGYYVGGGAALYGERPGLLRGERRYAHEGTWGIDYQLWFSRVRLQWFHGTRLQDGEGQYEPDEKNNPLIPLFFR